VLPDRSETASTLQTPAPGTIDLWLINLAIHADAAAEMSAVLDTAELARADRFATATLRARFVAAHASVRAILAAYLGSTPVAVSFVRGERGKPHVPSGNLAFNVSHSGELAVCVVAAGGRCGVDIERVRAVPDAGQLADTYFSHGEADELRRLPVDTRDRAFLGTWTRKEAFLKATGEGLSRPLDSVDVTAAPTGWWIRSFDPGPGYLGTVAHDRPIAGVTSRAWRWTMATELSRRSRSSSDRWSAPCRSAER